MVLATIFFLYRFIAWFYSDIKPKKYGIAYFPFTVIICVKDEDPDRFIKVLRTLINSDGEKEILVGDDGSKTPVSQILKHQKDIIENIRLFRVNKNIGKKAMQCHLIRQASHEILVNLDSDVILNSNYEIQKLISPFSDKRIGLTNGNVKIMDPSKSILTRIQAFMYYCANQIGRKSWGHLGINPVASGELLAFRKSYFLPVLKEYETKRFLGNKINFGEDRLMTNLLLREGYKSIYVEESIAYTNAAETVNKYINQQIRWRRSGIRESIFTLSFSKNVFLNILVGAKLILPLFFTILMFSILFYDLISLNFMHMLSFMLIIVFVTFIGNLPMLIESPKRIIDMIFFSIFNTLVLTPLWIYAMFTLDKTTWGTR